MQAMTDVVCHSGPDGKKSVVSVEANSGCLAYWRLLAPARAHGAFTYEELAAALASTGGDHARCRPMTRSDYGPMRRRGFLISLVGAFQSVIDRRARATPAAAARRDVPVDTGRERKPSEAGTTTGVAS